MPSSSGAAESPSIAFLVGLFNCMNGCFQARSAAPAQHLFYLGLLWSGAPFFVGVLRFGGYGCPRGTVWLRPACWSGRPTTRLALRLPLTRPP